MASILCYAFRPLHFSSFRNTRRQNAIFRNKEALSGALVFFLPLIRNILLLSFLSVWAHSDWHGYFILPHSCVIITFFCVTLIVYAGNNKELGQRRGYLLILSKKVTTLEAQRPVEADYCRHTKQNSRCN